MKLSTFGELVLEGSDFAGPKSLLLLAYVALEGAQPRGKLAELFWPGSTNARNRLSTTLTRLRHLGEGVVGADDARVWTPLESDARSLLEATEAGRHRVVVELYAAPFLAGIEVSASQELEEWVFATREFLADHVRTAQLALAERASARGRQAEAADRVADAYDLAGASPAGPTDLVRMHTLLVAAGHPLAAEVFRDLSEFEDLERHAVASSQEARRRIATLDLDANGSLRGLPTPATPFVGREAECREIVARLGDPDVRLLSIVAPGGMGKTRLAIEAATRFAVEANAEVGFVALADVARPDGVAPAIAEALGLRVAEENAPEQVIGALAARDLLLVLDNFEHVVEAADFVGDLLASGPRVTVLTTSRERLQLRLESVFPIGGLERAERAEQVGSNPTDGAYSDALRLFAQAARKVRRDFALEGAAAEVAAGICARVGGMPLAIELAAGLLDSLPLAAIEAELERGLAVLETSMRDVPERHRSVQAALDASWERLRPAERTSLEALSVFAGGVRREAAAEVAGADLTILRRLVATSFISREGDRYSMHEAVRQHARERLARDPNRTRAVLDRHAEVTLEHVRGQEHTFRGPDLRARLEHLLRDHANIERAWLRAIDRGMWDLIARSIEAVATLYVFTNRETDANALFDAAFRALNATDDRPDIDEGTEMRIAALHAFVVLDTRHAYEEATPAVERALELYRRLEDSPEPHPMTHPLLPASAHARRTGDYAGALAHAERFLDATRADFPVLGAICGHAFAASALKDLRRYEEAYEHLVEGHRIARDHHEVLHAENYAVLLGNAESSRGNYDAARAHLERGLSYAHADGNEVKVVECEFALAHLELAEGKPEAALVRLAAARKRSVAIGWSRMTWYLDLNRARAELRTGSPAVAARLLRSALAQEWRGRASRDVVLVLGKFAEFAEATGLDDLHDDVLRWLAGHPAAIVPTQVLARGGHDRDAAVAIPDLDELVRRIDAALERASDASDTQTLHATPGVDS